MLIPEIPLSIFDKFPEIKTNRLRLRQMQQEDAQTIFEMRINPNVNRFIARQPMQNFEEAQQKLDQVLETYRDKKAIGWGAVLRDGNKMIGACGYHKIDFYNRRAEIGGEMHPDFWGKNIALEAVQEIVKFGLGTMNLQTIEAWLSPNNRGAVALLSALGFRKEAHLTNYFILGEAFADMAIYALHPEWFTPVKL